MTEKPKTQMILEALASGPMSAAEVHKAIGGTEEGVRPLGATYEALRGLQSRGLVEKSPVMFQVAKKTKKRGSK